MMLHLIRHGRTVANEKGLYCGFTDIPLSDGGAKELFELKQVIAYPTADYYIVSGLLRTKQTMEILYDSSSYKTIESFREINFGRFEMRKHEELRSDLEYQNWIADIENASPSNGESKADFIKRVGNGFSEVKCLCELNAIASAVIITHGGVISAIMDHLHPGHKSFYQWQPGHGRGYTIFLEKSGSVRYAAI